MDRSRRLFVVPALSALVLAIGCAGPRFPAPIEDVPVCADYTFGHTKMVGALRYPVRLKVRNGKSIVFQTMIPGRRSADEPTPSTYIADDNAKYTVEWMQCGNEHAPHPVAVAERDAKAKDKGKDHEVEGMSYECGESKIYKTETLETKKGDRASHVLHFAPPPMPECWASESVPPPEPGPADAGAADAAPESASDAGVSDAGAAASDAGASVRDAGPAASADAGAKH